MKLWRKHPSLLRGAALLLCAAAALLPGFWAPQALSGMEESIGDMYWRLGASSRPERRVVVVDIDEKSLAELGAWPWSRSTMAELSARLSSADARLQAFDITFSEPATGDAALQSAWAAAPTVVAQLFSLDPGVTPKIGEVSGALPSALCPPSAAQAYGHYGTVPALLSARPAVGHINPTVGADGVIRHVPALICNDGRSYASLALTTIWQLTQPGPSEVAAEARSNGPDWQWHASPEASPFIWGLAPAAWLTSPSLPGLVVPLDARGNLRVPYALTRDAFAAVSAVDVLKGRFDPRLFKGAIVMVGATAFGMGDTVATPHGAVASGLEVHTQAMVGLLDHDLPYTPAAWPLLKALGLLSIGGVLLTVATRRRGVPAKRLPLVGVAIAVVCLVGSAAATLQFGLWLPSVQLVAFALMASAALATVEHAFARAQRERLSAHLGAYLPAPVAQRLMASDPSGKLQLEPRSISVLVADIRNFSALATHCRPEEVAALLHAYCCVVVDVVERHRGVVENVVGDSITAVWTASVECEDHHLCALAAAEELIRATLSLLASSHPVAEHSPVQPLALGIGVETGVAIVGSFGPARRRAHAALGEPVSVASRIQQMTSELSMPILVGPQLAALLPAKGVEPLGEYLLEGLAKHYELYAPVGWADLVSVDSNWASSAAGPAERQSDYSEWSRWGKVTRHGASAPDVLRTLTSALRRRDA
jgi:adenylate cyclase